MRAVRSFDPCLPCGVHMYLGKGKVKKVMHRPTGLSLTPRRRDGHGGRGHPTDDRPRGPDGPGAGARGSALGGRPTRPRSPWPMSWSRSLVRALRRWPAPGDGGAGRRRGRRARRSAALMDDGVVASLLLVHDLYPVDSGDAGGARRWPPVRPYMESHGGDVELLGIEDGVARLRLEGSCSGLPGRRRPRWSWRSSRRWTSTLPTWPDSRRRGRSRTRRRRSRRQWASTCRWQATARRCRSPAMPGTAR